MDTRSKIINWAEAKVLLERRLSEGRPPILVAGYFDPMLAPHAESLSRLAGGGPAWVIVHDPPEPVLPLRARAEMVAALRTVERVILGDDTVLEEVKQFTGQLIAQEADHLRFREEFVRRVVERHAQPDGDGSRS